MQRRIIHKYSTILALLLVLNGNEGTNRFTPNGKKN